MVTNYLKIIFELFKEKLRPLVHPTINKNNKTLFFERKEFYSSFLSENDLVFDVGANLGNRVEVFLALKNKVIAVEPQNYCSGYLNIKFGDKITLKKIALGSKKGKLPIYINSKSSTISSLSKDWITIMQNARFQGQKWDKTEEVDVDTLDNLIKENGKPKFIKIDVEGFETDVLKGLTQAIPIISFEYATPEQTVRLFECLDIIKKIDPNYICNYSAGEKNKFVLEKWLTIEELRKIVSENIHSMEGFGDIYVSLPGSTVFI